MKVSLKKIIASTGTAALLTGIVAPGVAAATPENETAEYNVQESSFEIKIVDTVEEVYNDGGNSLFSTSNVNRSEFTNAETQEYVRELRSFANGSSPISDFLSYIPVIGDLLSGGLGLSSSQATELANEIEAANNGNGVVQVINLNTGATAFQSR